MKYIIDGSKKIVIIEDDSGWVVETSKIVHDIIVPIKHFKFNDEYECFDYVKKFFKKPATNDG